MSTYKVELLPFIDQGKRKSMWRAGREFTAGQPQILELTADEVEVFENDNRFSIKDSKDSGETISGGETRESDSVPQSTEGTTEDTLAGEDETQEDTVATSQEEISGEDEELDNTEDLLKLSRTDLNAKALELGIKNPEELANKTEVAQAIVEVQ